MLQQQLEFILVFTLLCATAHIPEHKSIYQSMPAYIITTKGDLLNSTCGKELQDLRKAIDQRILWSLKVLDSSGGFKPGFLYGNNYWLGSRRQCLDTMNKSHLQISEQKILNNTLHRDSQKEFPPFQINYFVAHFKHNSNVQYPIRMYKDVIMLGLCLPASCTINNLHFIMEMILYDEVNFINNLYFTDFQLIQVKDLKRNNEWLNSSVSLFTCVALGLFFLMTTTGTMYDIFVHQKHVKKEGMDVTNHSMKNISKEIKGNMNSFSQENKIGKVLMCFSAYTNTRNMFSTKLDADKIPVIHGLKFLNMCLIIIVHSLYFAMESIDNKVWMWKFLENYDPYLVHIIALSVDIFFLSSGCLMTYLYLKDKTKKTPIKSVDNRKEVSEFFNNIIKRFIRLTPAYMVVLGISKLSSDWFDKTSQFYIYERWHETCAKYWWRNILYINNMFDIDEMCMSWSWYISNDMQYYIITTILLILSTIYFYAAITILGGLLIGSIILNAYIAYIYKYIPTLYELNKLADVLYISPWIRIIPYIIGIITGYILTKLNNQLVLKKKLVILCWCLAIACNIFVLFLLNKRSVLATVVYMVLHRIFWAIGIAWIIIACSTKHGGIVNKLLSFKGWIPLSRLTYCAYLLNPVIIRSTCLYSETSFHFEFLSWVIKSTGFITISFFCSYVLSLMVEIPCILLMRMFIYCNRMHTNYQIAKSAEADFEQSMLPISDGRKTTNFTQISHKFHTE